MKLCGMLTSEAQPQRITEVPHARLAQHPARSKDAEPRSRPCRYECHHHRREYRILRGSLSMCTRRRSVQVHSRYTRTLSDLPYQGIPVTLCLHAKRFFCTLSSHSLMPASCSISASWCSQNSLM